MPDLHWNHDPAWAGDGKAIHAKCDYRLVLDNLMDLTHETFVHGSSIGNEAVAEAPFDVTHGEKTVTVTRWMRGIEPPPFWAKQLGKPGHRRPLADHPLRGSLHHRYRRRRGADRHRRAGGRPLAGRQWLGDQHHHARDRQDLPLFLGLRAQPPPHRAAGDHRDPRRHLQGIFHEDELIVEAQQRAMDENPDHVFYNLNIDAGAMWARRLIDQMVAKEDAAAAPPGRGVGHGRARGRPLRVADREGAARAADQILSGILRPGERISELQAVETTGASRTPVRMALVRLEEEGLLEAIPSGGFTVKAFSERDILDSIELRGTLEGLAARFAAERGVSARELEPLKECHLRRSTTCCARCRSRSMPSRPMSR